jgi:hypothetical protein
VSVMLRTSLPWVLVGALACAGACSSGNGAVPTPPRSFSEVFLSIDAWNEARVTAVVIDQAGRRTGWTQEGPIDGIKGCVRGSGWEEGIPILERWSVEGDTTALPPPGSLFVDVPIDTMSHEPEPTPKYYYFHISNDAVTPVGLIDQGGCELRLDPIVAGKVQLGLSAKKGVLILCQDTTSVRVRPGVPLRWRLSWKARGDKCIVRIAELPARSLKR